MAIPKAPAWWDASWNPIGGCMAVSPACKNCYAAHLSARAWKQFPLYRQTTEYVRGKPVFNGELTVLPPEHRSWLWPLQWRGADDPLLGPGQPSLIFVGDMSCLFHEQRPATVIHQVVSAVAGSKHIGLLLTKRPQVMAEYFLAPDSDRRKSWRARFWLGFTAERQREFDARWPLMRELPQRGWIVFVSVAPMLGPVTLPPDFLAYGNRVWIICGGEQGANARFTDPDWARALRDQCAAAGVPFFMLQMGRGQHIPLDLFIRQFPYVGSASKAENFQPEGPFNVRF
jgi:protein gp37